MSEHAVSIEPMDYWLSHCDNRCVGGGNMTVQFPHQVRVEDVSGHVEVMGMSANTVQEAIALY